jgi:ketosteroid isomerase-like protein
MRLTPSLEATVDDVGEFLSTVLPLMRDEVVGLHDGKAGPRTAVWSHTEPVTLFGAEMSRRGWDQLEPAFEGLAASFSGSEAFENEVVAAGVDGDLGYVVAIEHSTASRRGAAPSAYALRVTTVFRREDGDWKIVHRHGDRCTDSLALPG